MPKTKSASKKAAARRASTRTRPELDSVYFLKLVLYLVVGSQWLRLEHAGGGGQIPLPIGLAIGVLFVMHDHFQIDRKIEFAVLLLAMFIGFWTQVGVYLTY